LARVGQTYVSQIELGGQNLALAMLAVAAGLQVSLVFAQDDM
jgi:hypothetical protein